MTAATELRDALMAYEPLTAAVTAVRADLGVEEDGFPFIVFKRVVHEPFFGLDNSLHASRHQFQVECWGGTRSESNDIADLAMEALIAAGLPPSPSDPDAIDPEIGARASVINVDVWT